MCWACEHTLASASEKDAVVRLYNFDTEDNYVLQPEVVEGGAGGGVNRIACLASDTRCGACCSSLVFWPGTQPQAAAAWPSGATFPDDRYRCGPSCP